MYLVDRESGGDQAGTEDEAEGKPTKEVDKPPIASTTTSNNTLAKCRAANVPILEFWMSLATER